MDKNYAELVKDDRLKEMNAEIDQLQVDIARGFASLQLLGERDASDLVDVRRSFDQMRIKLHGLELELAATLAAFGVRLDTMEVACRRDTTRDDTQKQSLRLERFDQRVEVVERAVADAKRLVQEDKDKREKGELHLEAESVKGRWAFKTAIGAAVVSAIVSLGALILTWYLNHLG